MSPVKPLNEKVQVHRIEQKANARLKESRENCEKSQKDIQCMVQLEISVETYKTLVQVAMAQGLRVEELVARTVRSLAGE